MDLAKLAPVIAEHGTPLYAYDWRVIKARIESLARFDVIRYAQKASDSRRPMKCSTSTAVSVVASKGTRPCLDIRVLRFTSRYPNDPVMPGGRRAT